MKTLLGNFGLCGLVKKKYHLFINERRIKKMKKTVCIRLNISLIIMLIKVLKFCVSFNNHNRILKYLPKWW